MRIWTENSVYVLERLGRSVRLTKESQVGKRLSLAGQGIHLGDRFEVKVGSRLFLFRKDEIILMTSQVKRIEA